MCLIICRIGHLKIFQRGGDIIVEGGQPNDDKKQTKGGRGVENGQNLVDVIYGCPLWEVMAKIDNLILTKI